jgi:Putative adhesin
MRTIFRATAALALLAASLPALAESATVARAWQFKPESVEGLLVRNLIGDVRVERSTTPGVHVTARATVEADTQAEAERLAGLIDYRTRDAGARSSLEIRLPREHFPRIYSESGASGWWSVSYVEYLGERIRLSNDKGGDTRVVRVDLLIRAPEGAKLDVRNVFGNGTAEGFSGDLRLDGTSGRLSSTGGTGGLVLDNGSGEVVVAGHRGRVGADTGSGSVTISDCDCDITADTGSGAVDVKGGKGRISADTGSGSVQVESFAGSLLADTGSGSVQARGMSAVEKLEVDTGSGSVAVEGDLSALSSLAIDTGSGSVNLRSSAQPSLEIVIDTGSGDVDVEAPGSSLRETDDTWVVRLKDGAGRGVIDTGSGGVEIDFR